MSRRLTPEEKAERAAAAQAKQKAVIEAHVKKLVADFPPLSNAQLDRIAILLRPASLVSRGPRVPTAYELEQERKARAREDALREAQQLSESMTACDVCDLQPAAHVAQKLSEFGFHDWEPGRAAKVMAKQMN